MVSKKLRSFIVEGKEVQFNIAKFKDLFVERAAREKKTLGEYEFDLADELALDSSSIHLWRFEKNGPGDLDKIHAIEKYWHLSENSLLMEVKQMENKRPLSDGERKILAEMYKKYSNILEKAHWSFLFKYEADSPYDWEFEPIEYKGNPVMLYESFCETINDAYFMLRKELYDQLIDCRGKVYTITHGNFEEIKKVFELPECLDADSYYEYLMDDDEIEETVSEKIWFSQVDRFKEIVEPYLAM